MRGAPAEHLAFIWLPLLLLALLQVSWPRAAANRGRPRPVLWGGAAVAGLVLTHNLTVLLAVPVLAAWVLLLTFAGVSDGAARWRFLRGRCLWGCWPSCSALPSGCRWSRKRVTSARAISPRGVRRLVECARAAPPSARRELGSPLRYAGSAASSTAWGWRKRTGRARLLVGLVQRRRLSVPCCGLRAACPAGRPSSLFMQSALSAAIPRIPGLLLLQFLALADTGRFETAADRVTSHLHAARNSISQLQPTIRWTRMDTLTGQRQQNLHARRRSP